MISPADRLARVRWLTACRVSLVAQLLLALAAGVAATIGGRVQLWEVWVWVATITGDTVWILRMMGDR
jgi:hypothetical protein